MTYSCQWGSALPNVAGSNFCDPRWDTLACLVLLSDSTINSDYYSAEHGFNTNSGSMYQDHASHTPKNCFFRMAE